MWKNYFKAAFRNLKRNKANGFINVIGLTLGIAGALVIYTIVIYETGFDAFHSRYEHTYRLVHHNHTADGTQYWNTTAYPLAAALREEFPEVEVTQASGPIQAYLSTLDERKEKRFQEEKIWFVDQRYFNVFDFDQAYPSGGLWISGDPAKAFDEPNAVVLTLNAALKYFQEGSERPDELLGKPLLLNDESLLVVRGIIQNPPFNSNIPFEILLSYEYFLTHHGQQAESWEGNHQGTTYMVLPDGADLDSYNSQIASLKKRYLNKEDDARIEYRLQPLSEVHTNALYGSSPGSYIISKGIIRGLVLLSAVLILIACVNFINLATAQSLKRVKEIGVRKVMGSTRKQLFLQYMCEAFVLTVCAFFCGFFLGDWVIGEINRLVDFADFRFSMDFGFLSISLLLIFAITFLTGCYPALVMSGFSPILAMKNQWAIKNRFGLSFRHGMIVFQFFIAQALVAGTFVVASQMHYVLQKDLGYQKENIISVNLPDTDQDKKNAVREKLRQRPEIQQVSFSSGAPTTHERQFGTSFRQSHEPPEMRRGAELKFIDKEYFALFQLNLLAGKAEGQYNPTLSDGFLVNEALLKQLGVEAEEAVGMELLTNEGKAPIIGVVEDFHNNVLQEEIMPCIMAFWGSHFQDEVNILLRADLEDPSKAISLIQNAWKEVYPDADFSFEFVDDQLKRHYKVETYLFNAFQIASGLAIFIGCLGLYGLVSLVAQQKTKEIGIRKLIGASIPNIVRLLSWDFMKLIFLAIGLATPLIYFLMDNWLQNFAYQVKLEWYYFAGASMVTIVIALVTLSFKSIKAAKMNPVYSLKSE
ncbi:FtsX-like permease family protein [Litoribacter populi]|uniref:FtsX-like permease family protein n=1 Tax=Litoribacter populi TaxID=2598460 RepID=UPI00117C498C|nr:FtsX-like permease family protein [Litoribacter populi]